MLATTLKRSEFHKTAGPKSATVGSKTGLGPIRGHPATQAPYEPTASAQIAARPTVPKVQRQLLAARLALPSIFAGQSKSAPEADILLKRGTIIDGTGSKPYQGSVLI